MDLAPSGVEGLIHSGQREFLENDPSSVIEYAGLVRTNSKPDFKKYSDSHILHGKRLVGIIGNNLANSYCSLLFTASPSSSPSS